MTIKHRRFRLQKCFYGVLVVKYKQSSHSKNPDAVLELRRGKTKVGKQGFRSLFLLETTKQKLNINLENLISFPVIYRFIGLRHETTEICSINRNTLKLNSNLNSLVAGRKEMVLASLKGKVQSTSTFSCHMRTLKIPAL